MVDPAFLIVAAVSAAVSIACYWRASRWGRRIRHGELKW